MRAYAQHGRMLICSTKLALYMETAARWVARARWAASASFVSGFINMGTLTVRRSGRAHGGPP
jgi:hypothetical protein